MSKKKKSGNAAEAKTNSKVNAEQAEKDTAKKAESEKPASVKETKTAGSAKDSQKAGADASAEKKSFNPLELLPLVILLALELFYWRNVIFTDAMLGDLGDGRFTALSTEHWWKFFTGKEKFSIIPVFYPIRIAIGYSDMHLGFGLLHSVFRLFGADIYLAFKYAVFSMHLIGMYGMYFLLRKSFRISPVWSTFGAVAFSHCCALVSLSNHPQLFAVGMLPPILICFVAFVKNFHNRLKRNVYACATIFLFVLLTYTSWYIACFTGIFSLIFIILYLIVSARAGQKPFKEIKNWVMTMKWDLLGYVIFMVILFIPFLSIYIPVMKEGRSYSYSGVFLPDPVDLINVGENNLMMGWFMKLIDIGKRGRDLELTVGFSVVLLAVFILALIKWIPLHGKKMKVEQIIPRCTLLCVVICLFLVIRWDGKELSAWALVYELLPPARALSSVSRFYLWLCFPMSIISAFFMDRFLAGSAARKNRNGIIAFVLLGLLVFSSVNKTGLLAFLNHGERKAVLDGIAAAPEDAESFYVTDSAKSGQLQFYYQLDAWEVAETTGVSSINAGAWYAPPGWYVWDVCSDDYPLYAQKWIDDNALENVYSYDLATKVWTKVR
ncbi:MAG: hypothetical protein K6E50_15355 [Lachnospiraceae bacterium]|nr:hypothetical protein [Lachnospiraceae bacterium]